MKFLFTADLHLTSYSSDKIVTETNLPERLDSIFNCLDNMIEFCKKNNIKNFIIGGDCFHNKEIMYTLPHSLFLDFLQRNNDITFWLISGNHDLAYKGINSPSALDSTRHFNNVKYIEKPTHIENIFFVPFSEEMTKDIKENKNKILISHFGLSEAKLNSGMSIISKLSLKDLENNYNLILLGHYHFPQNITTDKMNLYYSGSPIHLDWGEKNEIKRFLVCDSETLNIESIPTEGYKKYIELVINEEENKDSVIKQARKLRYEGHHVRIEWKIDSKIDEELNKEIRVNNKIISDITNRGVNIRMDERTKLEKYMEINDIKLEDRKEYLDIILEVIK